MSIEQLTRIIEDSKLTLDRVLQCREIYSQAMCNSRASTQMLKAYLNADLKALSSTIVTHQPFAEMQKKGDPGSNRKGDDYLKMPMYVNNLDDWMYKMSKTNSFVSHPHPTNTGASTKIEEIPDSQISQIESNTVSDMCDRSKSAVSERASKFSTIEIRGSDIDTKEFDDITRTSSLFLGAPKIEDSGNLKIKTHLPNELNKCKSDESTIGQVYPTGKEVDKKYSGKQTPEPKHSYRPVTPSSPSILQGGSVSDPQLCYGFVIDQTPDDSHLRQSTHYIGPNPRAKSTVAPRLPSQYMDPTTHFLNSPFFASRSLGDHTGTSLIVSQPFIYRSDISGEVLEPPGTLRPSESAAYSIFSEDESNLDVEEGGRRQSFRVKKSVAPPPYYNGMGNMHQLRSTAGTTDTVMKKSIGNGSPKRFSSVQRKGRTASEAVSPTKNTVLPPMETVRTAQASPKPQQFTDKQTHMNFDLGDLMKCMQNVYSELNRLDDTEVQFQGRLGSPISYVSTHSRAFSPVSPKKRRHHRVIKTTTRELT